MGRRTRNNEILLRVPQQGGGVIHRVLTFDDLSKMGTADILAVADDVVGGERRFYHDALCLVAGTALADGVFTDLFRYGMGQNGKTLNTGAAFVKSNFHCNLFDNGKFQWGESGIILAIEFQFSAPPAKPATVGTAGANTVGIVTDTADNASQPAGYNPVALQLAFLNQTDWRFHRGENVTEEGGRLIEVPASCGQSGFAGGGATFCLIQNSMGGYSVALRRPKTLESQEPFFIRVTSRSAMVVPVDLCGFMRLDTIAIEAVEIPDTGTVVDAAGNPFRQ